MKVSRYYLLFWLLGYSLLWGLYATGSWTGELWQVFVLAVVSLMITPLAISALFSKGLLFNESKRYRARRTRPSSKHPARKRTGSLKRCQIASESRRKTDNIPRLPEAHGTELTHGQVKLSCAIIRAFMMRPYYRTYRILYQPPAHHEPADITFRRRMLVQKDCQYYHDKSLAYLVSCELEKKLGTMTDPHRREMKHQAYQACRQTAMKLDPKNVNSASESMYLGLVNQAKQLAEYLYPSLLFLTHRITPSHRHIKLNLSESEIIHWFEYLDKQIKSMAL